MSKYKKQALLIIAIAIIVLLLSVLWLIPKNLAKNQVLSPYQSFYSLQKMGEDMELSSKNSPQEKIEYLQYLIDERLDDVEEFLPYDASLDEKVSGLVEGLELEDFEVAPKDDGFEFDDRKLGKNLYRIKEYYDIIAEVATDRSLSDEDTGDLVVMSFRHFRVLAVYDQYLDDFMSSFLNVSMGKMSNAMIEILEYHKGSMVVENYINHIYQINKLQLEAKGGEEGIINNQIPIINEDEGEGGDIE
jgi:hypothetical protein